jgi:hypothetical protein
VRLNHDTPTPRLSVRLATLLAMKKEAGRLQDIADIAALEGLSG